MILLVSHFRSIFALERNNDVILCPKGLIALVCLIARGSTKIIYETAVATVATNPNTT